MSKKDFISLSSDEQEAFINNGGLIEKDLSEDVTKVQVEISGSTEVSVPSTSGQLDGLPSQPALPFSFDGILINDPIELLYLLDEEIALGHTSLHTWQVEFMLDFAHGDRIDDFPFQALVRAANGSGKDKYIIAACAVWLCMRYKKAKSIVTSASGGQLDTQTCVHIKSLCDSANRRFGVQLWDCKYRQYTMTFGQEELSQFSYIFCYATDEPKKAEGYHPTTKGAKMGLFLSEDKTIPDEINIAINKCTGYTHRVHASTPGGQRGHFYDYCMGAVRRDDLNGVMEAGSTDWIQYHIPASKCSHLKESYIKQMKRDLPGGENGAAYKSQVEAEFAMEEGEMIVLPYTYIWQAVRNTFKTKHKPEPFNTGGLDLSDGGAETALSVRNGNKHLKTIPFRFDDSENTIEYLQQLFRENDLASPEALIFADCIGAGYPVLCRLRKLGWKNIRFVDSRRASSMPKVYKNLNAEIWFHMQQLFQRHEIMLQDDPVLTKQLSSRHYKLVNGVIYQMWSKLEERAKGHPSPDRADSLNYCFWGYESSYVEQLPETDEDRPFLIKEEKGKVVGDFSLKSWAYGPSKGLQPTTSDQKKKNFAYLQHQIDRHNQQVLVSNKQ